MRLICVMYTGHAKRRIRIVVSGITFLRDDAAGDRRLIQRRPVSRMSTAPASAVCACCIFHA